MKFAQIVYIIERFTFLKMRKFRQILWEMDPLKLLILFSHCSSNSCETYVDYVD